MNNAEKVQRVKGLTKGKKEKNCGVWSQFITFVQRQEMSRRVKIITRYFEQNLYNIEINKSGSVSGNSNEKIRSGQCYLYRNGGIQSTVYEV